MSATLGNERQLPAKPRPNAQVADMCEGENNGHQQAIPAKRPGDDDVEFICSKPVKKKRVMNEAPKVSQPKEDSLDRCRSMQVGAQVNLGMAGAENRGCSLPVMEKFQFPQVFAGPSQPRQLSEAVSPRQFPQTISPAQLDANAERHQTEMSARVAVDSSGDTMAAPNPPMPTVQLDQISCLDLSGSYMAPDADFSFLLGPHMPGGAGQPLNGDTPNRPAMANSQPFGPLPNQTRIPFALYSTGSLVPMPQRPTQMHASCTNAVPMHGLPSVSTSPQHAAGQASQGHSAEKRQSDTSTIVVATPFSTQQQSQSPRARAVLPPGHATRAPAKHHCLHCKMRHEQMRIQQGQQQCAGRPAAQIQGHNSPNHHAPTSHPSTRANTPVPGQLPKAVTPAAHGNKPQQANGPTTSATSQRKHGQDLLVDTAETVLEVFPYEEVARRHQVSSDKVREVLAAVVQLPLLRLRRGQAAVPSTGGSQ